ncbi:S41 family peptidase [Mycoplasma sp. CSL7475-4]|uniref:S41 family peptidase n=1 Tax=Mycoplasma sp. CSL7475-4 TaxID=2973942 RepID=UPI00216B56B7|nr:S41 family peptidase [Mycoplasma sp. CSL7475-4]MCS4536517.1 S41 family peptidase [Mycoplasma sp. CSL7475-4]
MKFKSTLKFMPLIAATSLAPIASVACLRLVHRDIFVSEDVPDELDFVANASFSNISNNYVIANQNINIFKNKQNKDTYINVNEVIKKLNGYFDLEKISQIDVVDDKGVIEKNDGDVIEFALGQDVIIYSGSEAFELAKSSVSYDYNKYIHFLNFSTKSLRPKDELLPYIDLGKYNMKIFAKNKNIYMPLSLFNLLFMSQNYYNLQYNGVSLVGIDYDISHDADNVEYEKFYNQSKLEVNDQQRLNNYNFLALLFDNFYGLSSELYKKYNSTSFDEFTHSVGLYDKIIDKKYSVYTGAYQQLWYKYLNELHSRIITKGYAAPSNTNLNQKDGRTLSRKWQEYMQVLDKLTKLREQEEPKNIVVIENDVARIRIDSFLSGTNEEIARGDSYLYDSYELMKAAIAKIQRVDTEGKVKNIVIDISQNGGGSSAALEKVVGFLTKKPYSLFVQDRMTKTYSDIEIGIDTNSDGKYNSEDGYNQYHWYLLTGINTFSAANLFAHIVKQSGMAKIIGQKSGGGMFAVLPTILPDGTNVDISGPDAWTGPKSNVNSISDLPISEHGVKPDYIYSYDDFYNLKKIRDFIKSIDNH